jgi:hypothetical protein
MKSVRSIVVLIGAVVGVGVLAAPAWALAPGHANITFATGSTGSATATGVTAAAARVWTPGASDIHGVGCCASDITKTATGEKVIEGTTQTRFPFVWNSDDSARFQVDSFDARGNYVGTAFTNAPSFVSEVGEVADTTATYIGTWHTESNADALDGSLHFSTAKGASATLSANVRTVAWITTVGPTHGSARVFLDGKLVATVSTHAASIGHRRTKFARAWWGGPNDPVHTIRIVNAGTPGHSRVDVDGVLTVTED